MLLVLAAIPSALWLFLPTLEGRGQFGDMFGLANSLFSGCAFAGLIYTIVLQRRELTLQRQELALTRAELARSATAQENAERALAAQVRTANQSARLTAIAHLLEYHDRQIEHTERKMARNPKVAIGIDSPRQREYLARALEKMSRELVADGDLPEDPRIFFSRSSQPEPQNPPNEAPPLNARG